MAAGTLYVVATPIGNLEDITLRALRILKQVHLIAAEDTRRTAKLLAHYGIHTPTVSFHAHNSRARLPRLLDELQKGRSVALVSDAGTPTVSDPGVELVKACQGAGVPVDPVPGPSAFLAAAACSGFPLNPVTMLGFAPVRTKDRNRFIELIAETPHTVVFFESPHRIRECIRSLGLILGERHIMVARELTKVHQQLLSGTASAVAGEPVQALGEFTIVVGPANEILENKQASPNDTEIEHEFEHLTRRGGRSRREVVNEVAKRHGIPAREAYAAIERVKKSLE